MFNVACFSDNFLAEELPQIIKLHRNLFAVKFSLMKMIPARFILDRAAARGELQPGGTILETSSGTIALAMARLACQRHYSLVIVSDPEIEPLRVRLETLGTRVEVVRPSYGSEGIQAARLRRLRELADTLPNHYQPNQYGNPDNPASYASVAEMITEAVGEVACLVGPVGSGGSMCGTARFLRVLYPELQSVAVDTFGSVLFGMRDGRRHLRGLGNSTMPANVDHRIFDEVHWIDAPTAFCATRRLYQLHDLFMGPTSGAAWLVATYLAERTQGAVVLLCPDTGDRYRDTVYNSDWLWQRNLWVCDLPCEARRVEHPDDAQPPWSFLAWARREFQEVISGPGPTAAVTD